MSLFSLNTWAMVSFDGPRQNGLQSKCTNTKMYPLFQVKMYPSWAMFLVKMYPLKPKCTQKVWSKCTLCENIFLMSSELLIII